MLKLILEYKMLINGVRAVDSNLTCQIEEKLLFMPTKQSLCDQIGQ